MNYPMVRGYAADKQVVALYADLVLTLDRSRPTARIDVVNAKGSRQVVLSVPQDLGVYRYEIRDCLGRTVKQGQMTLGKGLVELDVPLSGLVSLERVTASAPARN
jgi:hypothetical protein